MEIRVIIEDGFISINGQGRQGFIFDETYSDIKAIQSIDGKTHVLYKNGNGDFEDDFNLEYFVGLYNDQVAVEAAKEQEYRNSDEFKLNALAAYRYEKQNTYVYKNVPMSLDVGPRHDLSTLWLVSLANTNIPDSQVMAVWQEPGYDDLNITAGDLRADGEAIMGHYQKCWAAQAVVKANIANYSTIQEIQEAFDAAYAT